MATFENFCAETIEGIEELASKELIKKFGGKIKIISILPGFIFFQSEFNSKKFYELKTIKDVYLSLDVKSFNSTPEVKNIIHNIKIVLSKNKIFFGESYFKTFKVTARGANNKDFINLKNIIHKETKLKLVFEQGDLVIRKFDNFESLFIRTTIRPLYSREWRNSNFKAALNANLAAAMILLTKPQKEDKVLNICAGSGTLLIERCLISPSPLIAIGYELDSNTLNYSKRNLKEAGLPKKYKISLGDCMGLTELVGTERFNVVLGDLPFGMTIGSKSGNYDLYSNLLSSVGKVAEKGARICLFTHDISNLDKVLSNLKDKLILKDKIQVKLKTSNDINIYPCIYHLEYIG